MNKSTLPLYKARLAPCFHSPRSEPSRAELSLHSTPKCYSNQRVDSKRFARYASMNWDVLVFFQAELDYSQEQQSERDKKKN